MLRFQKLKQGMIVGSLWLAMLGIPAGASAEPNLNNGKRLYKKHCLMCHGLKGEGRFGPNLTDNFWLYGNTTADIIKIVTEGVPDNGMVRWEGKLSETGIVDVVGYVESLKGSNPPHAKAPQGKEYPD